MADAENGSAAQAVESAAENPPAERQRRKPQRRNDQPNGSSSRQPPTHEEQMESVEVKYNAAHVIHLFVPVSLCMLLVIVSMRTIGYFSRNDGVYLIYTPFTKPTDSTSELFLMTVGNALILLCVVIVTSLVLIALYKFRFYKVIHGWLILSSVVMLGLIAALYIEELMKNYNLAVDALTFYFLVWNLAVLGMICVHWKGPHRLQQCYLVVMCALMALVFIKHLPEWTVWAVLAVLAVWDLVAVLCPNGPLRILVETAQQRNEPIFPALIYSCTAASFRRWPTLYTMVADSEPNDVDNPPTSAVEEPERSPAQIQPLSTQGQRIAPLRGRPQSSSTSALIGHPEGREEVRVVQPTRRERPPAAHEHEEDHGVKLGLGDFIFYSVLVGKASSYGDWNTTIACYVAILLGLTATLMLLALFRKALPALPISIFIGLIFYFTTRGVITPFVTDVSMNQYLL
ncbi:Presenilin [Aphelenchoides fujianensis]|nr:Presenilin [Aphelenchoides fujianensis]